MKIKPNMPMEEMAEHAIDFWLWTEDPPDPDNRITIDSEGQVVLSLTDANAEAHQRLKAKFESILGHTARVKRPGDLFVGDQRELRLTHGDLGTEAPYEKLLSDALTGNPALFANEQGVEAGWAALGEVLVNHDPVIAYPPGSWGPAEAAKLVPGGWDQISVERAPQSKPEASAADR